METIEKGESSEIAKINKLINEDPKTSKQRYEKKNKDI